MAVADQSVRSAAVPVAEDNGAARRPRAWWVAATTGVLTAVIAQVVAQNSMYFTLPDWRHGFRGLYAYDQLSYLAFVVNGAHGHLAVGEPFTETGRVFYPHAYYALLGLICWVAPISPIAAWALGGLVLEAALVALVACACVRLSGRAWTAPLAAVPLLYGTFSSLSSDNWFTPLQSHAVLWGPYGELFALNGAVAALVLASAGLLGLLVLAVSGGRRTARRLLLSTFGCGLLLGAVANVHTYVFLTGCYLAIYAAAAAGVAFAASRFWAFAGGVATVALLALLYTLAPGAGLTQLTVLALGVVPALPGLVLLATRALRPVISAVVGAVLGAAPQLAWTLYGVHVGDPFLQYRQAASTRLGVPWRDGLLAAGVPGAVLAAVLLAGLWRRHRIWIAIPVGLTLAWALLATNDVWGADQEPYRLWIDAFCLVSLVGLPLVLQVARWAFRRSAGTAARSLAGAAVVVLVAGAGVSALDFGGFWVAARNAGLLHYDTPRDTAVATALAGTGTGGAVLPDPCLTPFQVKIDYGGPVAFYNAGMAWPANQPAYGRLLAQRAAGVFDAQAARAAGVAGVVTDSACPVRWAVTYRSLLVRQRAARYPGGTIEYWRLAAG